MPIKARGDLLRLDLFMALSGRREARAQSPGGSDHSGAPGHRRRHGASHCDKPGVLGGSTRNCRFQAQPSARARQRTGPSGRTKAWTHRQAAIVCFWLERTSRGVYRHVRLRPVSEAEWASQQPRQCCDFCGGPRSIPSFATMQRKTAIIPMPRLPTGISVRSMLLPYIARPLLSFTRNIR